MSLISMYTASIFGYAHAREGSSCARGGIADVKAQARTVFVQQSGPRRFRAGRRIGQVDVTQTPRKPFGGGARGPRAS